MKKWISLGTAMLFVWVSSCAPMTRKMWEGPKRTAEVRQFITLEKNSHIVLMESHYRYIFSVDAELDTIINKAYQGVVPKLVFSQLAVQDDNKTILGNYVIHVNASSAQEGEWLGQHGFTADSKVVNHFIYTKHITGERQLMQAPGSTLQGSPEIYKIQIIEQASAAAKGAKIAATPATLVADVALNVLGIAAVATIFGAAMCDAEQGGCRPK